MASARKAARNAERPTTNTESRNLAVLEGEVSSEPVRRILPSGDSLLAFDLRVTSHDGRRQSIPVSWIGPDRRCPAVTEQAWALVIGEVRRRFYRSAAGLTSRVDVRADTIAIGTPARRRKALDRVVARLVPDRSTG